MSKINTYTNEDLAQMRKACRLAKETLDYISQFVKPHITTDELNTLCHEFIISHNATPAPLNYNGYPKSICTSVNHVICHGIPGAYALKTGDIINIDITVVLDGWFGDTSRTFIVEKCSKLAESLVDVAKESLYIGINAVKPYGHFGDIGEAIQDFVDKYGYSIVRDYCGHGIGREFHEPPTIIHYNSGSKGRQILPGMIFTIEPMINAGSYKSKVLKDGWTAVTVDKSLSAQFEHTIAVTEAGFEILTE